MLIVLSPAKTLDYDTPPTTDTHTLPDFLSHSSELIGVLKNLSPAEIASL
ncbi:MAG TPA: peroxide stress protein YaaA, partial [Noviherbaspirillum sp.]